MKERQVKVVEKKEENSLYRNGLTVATERYFFFFFPYVLSHSYAPSVPPTLTAKPPGISYFCVTKTYIKNHFSRGNDEHILTKVFFWFFFFYFRRELAREK
jgi:hypothetical protein